MNSIHKINWQILVIAVILIIGGYILMSGGEADDKYKFSNDIFNFRRITLAPIIVVAGYILVLLSIFLTSKRASKN